MLKVLVKCSVNDLLCYYGYSCENCYYYYQHKLIHIDPLFSMAPGSTSKSILWYH